MADTPKAGWGAVLRGEALDVGDWERALKLPFDPWVEVHGEDWVLRSASLDALTSADEVRERAVTLIERLNGAVALIENAIPLVFGGVVQLTPDGKLHRTMFLEGIARGRSRVHGAVLVPKPGEPPPDPKPSVVQNWSALADADDLLDDALIYYGRGDSWFDLFKSLESLMRRFGGHHAFLKLKWAPATEIERLKYTANWVRHARRRGDSPEKPLMQFSEARQLLGLLLRRALEPSR